MSLEVIGAEDVAKAFSEFAPRHANNLSRAVIHGVAGETRDEIKKRVPKRTGNLKRAIKVKRRRGKPGQPVSDVYVTQGKSAKYDGFYWRFIEHGTQTQPERPFVRPVSQWLRVNMGRIMQRQFAAKVTAAVNRELRKRAKR